VFVAGYIRCENRDGGVDLVAPGDLEDGFNIVAEYWVVYSCGNALEVEFGYLSCDRAGHGLPPELESTVSVFPKK
jgi:hypothetical protein